MKKIIGTILIINILINICIVPCIYAREMATTLRPDDKTASSPSDSGMGSIISSPSDHTPQKDEEESKDSAPSHETHKTIKKYTDYYSAIRGNVSQYIDLEFSEEYGKDATQISTTTIVGAVVELLDSSYNVLDTKICTKDNPDFEFLFSENNLPTGKYYIRYKLGYIDDSFKDLDDETIRSILSLNGQDYSIIQGPKPDTKAITKTISYSTTSSTSDILKKDPAKNSDKIQINSSNTNQVIIALDCSESMYSTYITLQDGSKTSLLTEAGIATIDLIKALFSSGSYMNIGLVFFKGNAYRKIGLTNNQDSLIESINELINDYADPQKKKQALSQWNVAFTNVASALDKCYDSLYLDNESQKDIILITDGCPTTINGKFPYLNDPYYNTLARDVYPDTIKKINEIKDHEINISTVLIEPTESAEKLGAQYIFDGVKPDYDLYDFLNDDEFTGDDLITKESKQGYIDKLTNWQSSSRTNYYNTYNENIYKTIAKKLAGNIEEQIQDNQVSNKKDEDEYNQAVSKTTIIKMEEQFTNTVLGFEDDDSLERRKQFSDKLIGYNSDNYDIKSKDFELINTYSTSGLSDNQKEELFNRIKQLSSLIYSSYTSGPYNITSTKELGAYLTSSHNNSYYCDIIVGKDSKGNNIYCHHLDTYEYYDNICAYSANLIVQAAEPAKYDIKCQTTKLKVTLSNGQVLFDKDCQINTSNNNKDDDLFFELDKDLMPGSIVEIDYTIKISANSIPLTKADIGIYIPYNLTLSDLKIDSSKTIDSIIEKSRNEMEQNGSIEYKDTLISLNRIFPSDNDYNVVVVSLSPKDANGAIATQTADYIFTIRVVAKITNATSFSVGQKASAEVLSYQNIGRRTATLDFVKLGSNYNIFFNSILPGNFDESDFSTTSTGFLYPSTGLENNYLNNCFDNCLEFFQSYLTHILQLFILLNINFLKF